MQTLNSYNTFEAFKPVSGIEGQNIYASLKDDFNTNKETEYIYRDSDEW